MTVQTLKGGRVMTLLEEAIKNFEQEIGEFEGLKKINAVTYEDYERIEKTRRLAEWLKELKERREQDVPDTNVGDMISRQTVRYKLAALVNEFEEILSHIREREVDDSVCGLCEYDGAYIGQSGDWCNECPGFDKDDCFKLKEKYREEWLKIDG